MSLMHKVTPRRIIRITKDGLMPLAMGFKGAPGKFHLLGLESAPDAMSYIIDSANESLNENCLIES